MKWLTINAIGLFSSHVEYIVNDLFYKYLMKYIFAIWKFDVIHFDKNVILMSISRKGVSRTF